jgi:hypothetical protein
MPRNWLSFTPNSIPFVAVHIGADHFKEGRVYIFPER